MENPNLIWMRTGGTPISGNHQRETSYQTHVEKSWKVIKSASGEEAEHAPENQGFDYAYYGLFNGAPDLWPDGYEMTAARRRLIGELPDEWSFEWEKRWEDMEIYGKIMNIS